MSYEKDLDYLKRELRNAQNIYDEAEKDERESDAEMWMNRVTHLEFQIEVFEKATKSDEYEAKAKAFDESLKGFKELERLHEEVRKASKRNRDKSEIYKEVLFHVIREMESNLGESGEPYAKK